MSLFKYILTITCFLVSLEGFAQPFPNCCNEYTSVGTQTAGVNPGTCATPGQVANGGCGTSAWTGTACSGFITSTVTGPAVSCLTLSYTAVNQNDYGTMTTDTGGILSITGVNTNVVGNVVGPFICGGAFVGSVEISVCSSIPFNSITLTNSGCTSGWVINCATQTGCGGGGGGNAGLDDLTTVMCNGTVDLDGLVTGDVGGTWTETSIPASGSFNTGTAVFNANTAAVGIYTFEYVVSGGCSGGDTALFQVEVVAPADASWTIPANLCSNGGLVDLSGLITGTAGGTWSGTGVTGTMFDPLSGTQNVTYSVGTAPCDAILMQSIPVTASLDPAWASPGSICESGGTISLDALITGDVGGTWSGTGVSGTNFDPTGLSGPISITYTIGAAPCIGVDVQNISVNPDVDPTWVAPTTLCDDSPQFDLNTALSGTAGGTWSGIGVTGNMFDPAAGSQTVTYTVGTAPCDEFSALMINVGVAPNPAWTTLTMCASDAPVNLTAQITGDLGGTWSGTGLSGSVFDPFFGTQSITYTVSAGTCTSFSTQTISVFDPQLTPSGTNISCFGLTDGSLDVTVSGGSGTYVYAWNTIPAQSTATATNVGAGTYTISVTDGSCVTVDTVTIIEPAEITATMSGTNGCTPSLGSTSIAAAGGVGGFTYAWNNSSLTTATATDLDSNMHTVTVTDANGCTYVDSILVQIYQAPIVGITADTTIEYGNELQLNAVGGASYSWDPIDNLDCSDCPNPVASPLQDTYYCATITDTNGCVNEACVLVKVIIICGDVFVPSGFSPNEDGENDILCVYSDCMEYLTFSVFNRWGEKVYETNSMSICWDGTWKGKLLNPAVFVYTLEGALINGELVQQSGNISLIR